MKLYYAPGACSLGIHFLLEEIGVAYDAARIIIKDGDQFKPDYTRINPKSKVPLLQRDDGSYLTEFGAIAHWLAHTIGTETLKSVSFEDELRTIETLDFVVGTIHMQGFSRLLRPQKFTPNEADLDWVRQAGRDIVTNGFVHLSAQLGTSSFIMGERLTVADAAMLYTLFWGIDRLALPLPQNLQAYYARLSTRPAAVKVFMDEGLK
ncbi:glutathione S-transferase family protein [Pararhodobacter zhoushanensis]|uniref:Glutathione S-transferase N-terminal domain-containing protein n=1 Tax=Pararhodobacter zhoushanensis TaxID=2479545 RepID=A0ABT3GU47_9RHOB|nr:glutathione S-transferase C-terminal domain-containing protein [Pararhodobacter zhoushanensis]MCW1931060.1 glutathione S-transferase N-terminal domain-containing protein [Pararhodobacter zhoushanensis]